MRAFPGAGRDMPAGAGAKRREWMDKLDPADEMNAHAQTGRTAAHFFREGLRRMDELVSMASGCPQP